MILISGLRVCLLLIQNRVPSHSNIMHWVLPTSNPLSQTHQTAVRLNVYTVLMGFQAAIYHGPVSAKLPCYIICLLREIVALYSLTLRNSAQNTMSNSQWVNSNFPQHDFIPDHMKYIWNRDRGFQRRIGLNCNPYEVPRVIFSGFYPRPVLVFGYCRCLRLSVCVSVCVCGNHMLVRAITHHPFELGSPNLDHRCKRPWLRSLLFWGVIDLDLQGQI